MIVWRGWGILVAILAALAYMAAHFCARKIWGEPLPVDIQAWAGFTAMLLAAGLVHFLNLLLEREEKPRVMIEKETGQEVVIRAHHDLFFIPVRFWPYLLAVLGVVLFFQQRT